jgi:hypothetical protein
MLNKQTKSNDSLRKQTSINFAEKTPLKEERKQTTGKNTNKNITHNKLERDFVLIYATRMQLIIFLHIPAVSTGQPV